MRGSQEPGLSGEAPSDQGQPKRRGRFPGSAEAAGTFPRVSRSGGDVSQGQPKRRGRFPRSAEAAGTFLEGGQTG
jgi:hypothetical protein